MLKYFVIIAATLGILAVFTKFPVKVLSQTAFVVPSTQLAITWGLLGLVAVVGLMVSRISTK